MSETKITKQQEAYLNSLICQRIKEDPENARLAKSFINERNPNLPRDLRCSLEDDKQGKVAYYIIKTAQQEPLLFFSLKCGILYRPGFHERVKAAFNKAKARYQVVAKGKTEPKWAVREIEEMKKDGVLPMHLKARIYNEYFRLKEDLRMLEKDMLEEQNVKISRAEKVYPGVEIVHFCKHDPAEDLWEEAGMGQSLGKTLFWHFVVPKILEINELVGCEYVYLFAADSSEERSLIGYYHGLNFELPMDMGTTRPVYDYGCAFMCQELGKLKKRQGQFFKAFNTPRREAAE